MKIDINSLVISIIIPVYNEDNTITELLSKVEEIKDIKKQLIIVDDGSTDQTYKKISEFQFKSSYLTLKHKKNQGKGSAIQTAKKFVRGDITIIQDGDLEYNPKDYNILIQPIINDECKVVYGSRVLFKNRYDSNNFISVFRVFANHLLTILSNIINNQKLTDAHTCYKVFKSDLFKKIELKEKRFNFCPEITTKISNMNIPIIEVPISYNGRDYKSGKKIKFKDAIDAVITLIKYKFFFRGKI